MQRHFSGHILWDTILMRRLTWGSVVIKISVLCPHPSCDVTLNLLSTSLFYLCSTRLSVKQQAAAFVKIGVFPEWDSSAAQDHFLDHNSCPHGPTRTGKAAEPNLRRAVALLLEHSCHPGRWLGPPMFLAHN